MLDNDFFEKMDHMNKALDLFKPKNDVFAVFEKMNQMNNALNLFNPKNDVFAAIDRKNKMIELFERSKNTLGLLSPISDVFAALECNNKAKALFENTNKGLDLFNSKKNIFTAIERNNIAMDSFFRRNSSLESLSLLHKKMELLTSSNDIFESWERTNKIMKSFNQTKLKSYDIYNTISKVIEDYDSTNEESNSDSEEQSLQVIQEIQHDLLYINDPHLNKSIIVTEAQRVKQIIHRIYRDNSILTDIDPRKFEEVIAELLASQGFEVALTKQTRDNGYDILALQSLNGFPLKFLVECKRYIARPIGIEIIRAFNNVILRQNANKGIIVTTSYFTKDAQKDKTITPYLLDFRDKNHVLEWINNYSANNGKQ